MGSFWDKNLPSLVPIILLFTSLLPQLIQQHPTFFFSFATSFSSFDHINLTIFNISFFFFNFWVFLLQQLRLKKLVLEVCSRSCRTACSIHKIRGIFDLPTNHFLNFWCSSCLLCWFHRWFCWYTFFFWFDCIEVL